MKVDGRCHCGKITYSAIVDPQSITICHCTDCQMLTGTVYRANIAAPAETFVLLSGAPRIYLKTAQSGSQRAHAFCADCGTPIHSSAPDLPTKYSLRVGCLAQRAEFGIARQQWCDSGLPWAVNLEDVPRLARQ
jgi:hypothetical protein